MIGQIFQFIGYIISAFVLFYIIKLIIFIAKNQTSMKVGFFLALRAIKRANRLTIFAIVAVMTATFLSLIVISGILSGLVEGSIKTYKEKALGDLIISPLDKKEVIANSEDIISLLKGDNRILGYSPKYITNGSVEANWKTLKSDDVPNKRSVNFYGINPDLEEKVTNLSENVKVGEWLQEEDASKYVLLGQNILEQYSVAGDVDNTLLKNVNPGDKVRIVIASSTNEYTVKGFVIIKNQEVGGSVFFVDKELQRLAGLLNQDVALISIRLNPNINPKDVKATLLANGFDQYAKIQTFEEGTPAFVTQLKDLFSLMGTLFGSVGIVVSAITLFIVIFINAITKRKQIGILKGIGIKSFAIEFSYIFQALVYTAIGCAIGLLIVYLAIKPLLDAHPIDFPFSDGVLVLETSTTIIRVLIFLVISIFAGYIPARSIVKRNTLDAILGR